MKSSKCKTGWRCFACLVFVFVLVLTACGGGGDNTPAPAADPANVGPGAAPGSGNGSTVPGNGSSTGPSAGGGSVPGSGSNTPPPLPPSTSSSRGYRVISREGGGRSSYRALNLADFSTVDNLAIGAQDRASVARAILIHQGTFDAGIQTLTDFRPAALFYVEDGRFWVMPLNGSAADLVPRQVSSESGVAVVCAINPQTSITNPLDGFIFVELAGPEPDAGCVDDNKLERVAINLQFDATTPARDLTPVLTDVKRVQAYEDFTNGGKIAGYLGENKRTLVRLNSNLSPEATVFTATQSLRTGHYSGRLAGRVFFVADHNLYQYHFDTQKISMPLFDFGSSQGFNEFFACDALHCFFLHKADQANAILYRIPADASSVALQITNLNSTDGIVVPSSMILTRHFVYYVTTSLTGGIPQQRLMRVAKTGDTPQEVDSAASLVNGVGISESNLDSVFYVKRDQAAGNATGDGAAFIRHEDGRLVSESAASAFVGFTVQRIDLVNHSAAGAILMVTGMPAPATKLGGGTLRAVTSGDPAVSRVLGTVPDDVQSLVAFGMGVAVPIDAFATEPPPSGRRFALVAKTDVANSLTPISPQPGPNETFFPSF